MFSSRKLATVAATLALCLGLGAYSDEGRITSHTLRRTTGVKLERTHATKVAIGEAVPYELDSGHYDGSPGGVKLVFDHTVQRESASWIRLRFDSLKLGPRDHIEIRSREFGTRQVVRQGEFGPGPAYSAYFSGSTLDVRLFVGPGARRSGFQISYIDVGFLEAPPRSICGNDGRVLSDDDRVCFLVFRQDYCLSDDEKLCGCPNGVCSAMGAENRCDGGPLNGRLCDADACTEVGDICWTGDTFAATAFFVDLHTEGQKFLLTAGHNIYSKGDENQQIGNISTTLHCRVYGCPVGNCVGGLCVGGTRAGKDCVAIPTPPEFPMATQIHQHAVTVLDGEFLAVGVPHDWALLSVAANAEPVVGFGLARVLGINKDVDVIGHGSDDVAQNHAFQQKASGKGSREGDIISHCVDTSVGNSGSPVIIAPDGGVWAIQVEPGCTAVPNTCVSNPPTDANEAVYIDHNHNGGGPGRGLSEALALVAGCQDDARGGPACPIPSVSTWGLVTMTLFLLCVGTLVISRPRVGGIRSLTNQRTSATGR